MVITLLGVKGWSEHKLYQVQLWAFVHFGIAMAGWLGLSFVPYLLFYFGDSNQSNFGDLLWWSTLIYQLAGLLNSTAPIFFYFYTVLSIPDEVDI